LSSKKIIHSFIAKLLAAFFGAMVVVFTSRWLGAEIRGQISLLLSWVGVWTMLSDFVSGSTIINLSANYQIRKIVRIALVWSVGISVLSGALLVLMQSIPAFIWAIPLLVLLMSSFSVLGGILIAKGKISHRNYIFASISLITILVLSVLTYVNGIENVGLREYLIALFCGWFLALLSIAFFSTPIINKSKETTLVPNFKMMFLNGSLSQSGHLLGYAISRLPFFLMDYFYDFTTLGIFSVAVILGETILIISASLGQILHAKVIHIKNKNDGIADTIKYTQVAFLLTLPTVLVAILIPSKFWVWLLKEDFEPLSQYIVLFAPAIIFQSISSILSHFYHAANQFMVLIKAHTLGCILGLIGIFSLQEILGIHGFVLGASFGYAGVLIYLIWHIKTHFGVKVNFFLPNLGTIKFILKGVVFKRNSVQNP
jgi:O-antigen/teichoic acid export membrane protein